MRLDFAATARFRLFAAGIVPGVADGTFCQAHRFRAWQNVWRYPRAGGGLRSAELRRFFTAGDAGKRSGFSPDVWLLPHRDFGIRALTGARRRVKHEVTKARRTEKDGVFFTTMDTKVHGARTGGSIPMDFGINALHRLNDDGINIGHEGTRGTALDFWARLSRSTRSTRFFW